MANLPLRFTAFHLWMWAVCLYVRCYSLLLQYRCHVCIHTHKHHWILTQQMFCITSLTHTLAHLPLRHPHLSLCLSERLRQSLTPISIFLTWSDRHHNSIIHSSVLHYQLPYLTVGGLRQSQFYHYNEFLLHVVSAGMKSVRDESLDPFVFLNGDLSRISIHQFSYWALGS